MQITSLQNALVKDATALQQKKYRDETGLFLVEGEGPCRDAIARDWACVRLFALAETGLPETCVVTSAILAKISKKDNPQDIIGIFRQRISNMPAKADFILALEEIRDPGNLGTIIRTAHAVSVKNIVLVGPCCDPFSPEVIRASMGSFSAVNLTTMTHDDFVAWTKQSGMQLCGTDVVNAVDYREYKYRNTILAMGNEQKGLSPKLKMHCARNVHIPMPGGTESLNLAMATGLVLYQTL